MYDFFQNKILKMSRRNQTDRARWEGVLFSRRPHSTCLEEDEGELCCDWVADAPPPKKKTHTHTPFL